MIDLTTSKKQLKRTIQRACERNISIPAFHQQQNPDLIPEKIKKKLSKISLWDINSFNLFRITWENEPVDARILACVGKWFPTGSHRVGVTFGCPVPRLITGQYDPTYEKVVWPSAGNYYRGGA